ncbi:hypothetical protein ES707_19742 [subsurface metagenome]
MLKKREFLKVSGAPGSGDPSRRQDPPAGVFFGKSDNVTLDKSRGNAAGYALDSFFVTSYFTDMRHMSATTNINFRLPDRTRYAFKKHVEALGLNLTDALNDLVYFSLGLEGDDLTKFFLMGRDSRFKFQQLWYKKEIDAGNRLWNMQEAVNKAIKKKLIVASFKEQMIERGGLQKIETAFYILEDYRQKRITEIRAKEKLAVVTGK